MSMAKYLVTASRPVFFTAPPAVQVAIAADASSKSLGRQPETKTTDQKSSCSAQPHLSPRLTEAVLARCARLHDVDKDQYKAHIRAQEIQLAARQLGFTLSGECFESEKWEWGARLDHRA
ncbi:hypothetical protein CC86DRAFT_386309 [Ophiobolus disseminans]|uniref:Uncharacterized protein n=1 Tax=Ophiobolus disseminans TaxID=1469910 RepID=A0A6A6ZKP7_9PLEO|nr:hypothetical protein CC86DRAFT_386309 [Ophiobolus disseminans]